MSPEARAVAQVLLDHHRQVCLRPGEAPSVDAAVLPYGVLCERAGLADFARAVGPLLREIAAWCHENGWPPINSLAVNYATRMPGPGYDKAPGCSLQRWPEEVGACMEFLGYPATV
jgi:hypothetical protein